MKRWEDQVATVTDTKARARVYCPICTHTVEAEVVVLSRHHPGKMKVVEGQKCRRCSTSLDAAYILDLLGGLN